MRNSVVSFYIQTPYLKFISNVFCSLHFREETESLLVVDTLINSLDSFGPSTHFYTHNLRSSISMWSQEHEVMIGKAVGKENDVPGLLRGKAVGKENPVSSPPPTKLIF